MHLLPVRHCGTDSTLTLTELEVKGLDACPLIMQRLLQRVHPATPIQRELVSDRNHFGLWTVIVQLGVVVPEGVGLLTTPKELNARLVERSAHSFSFPEFYVSRMLAFVAHRGLILHMVSLHYPCCFAEVVRSSKQA